jgi:hypothetical protein
MRAVLCAEMPAKRDGKERADRMSIGGLYSISKEGYICVILM